MKLLLTIAATGMIAAATPITAQAASDILPAGDTPMADFASGIIPIAEGCGPGRWRGPWGGCRGAGDWYAPPPVVYEGSNGCPPGFWRGPWGHCRDTPYHCRLPDGGWR